METKHLAQPGSHTQTIRLESAAELVEIEVPAGESRYLIYQSGLETDEQSYRFHLRHPDSRVTILGLIEAAGESTPHLQTEATHHAPRTRAETIVRTLSSDLAHPHFKGLISIGKAAQGSESYLNHHSLLLSPGAQSWTLPSLEILANEVKCSHAATMRSITDRELFYLRSRGLNREAARALLIHAFLADVQECQPNQPK
jgi:Fe-S cluster assembly protein SufD